MSKSHRSRSSQHRRKTKRNSKSFANSRTKSSANTNNVVAASVVGTVDLASKLSTNVVETLETIVSGLFHGASSVVATAGSVTDNVLSDFVDVKVTQVFNGAGKFAKHIAYALGGAVKKIPCVGNTSGYIVESVGSSIFHVVLSVGQLIGSSGRRFGKVAKKASDLVVYVIHVTDDQVKDTTGHVKDIVHQVNNTLTGKGPYNPPKLK